MDRRGEAPPSLGDHEVARPVCPGASRRRGRNPPPTGSHHLGGASSPVAGSTSGGFSSNASARRVVQFARSSADGRALKCSTEQRPGWLWIGNEPSAMGRQACARPLGGESRTVAHGGRKPPAQPRLCTEMRAPRAQRSTRVAPPSPALSSTLLRNLGRLPEIEAPTGAPIIDSVPRSDSARGPGSASRKLEDPGRRRLSVACGGRCPDGGLETGLGPTGGCDIKRSGQHL